MPIVSRRVGVLLLSFSSVSDQDQQKSMYTRAFRDHPAFELIAVSDETEASFEQHARNRHEAARAGLPYVPDLDQALSDPRVDLVTVCCPFERRTPVIQRVAAAGKQLLVETPLALNLADCVAIEQAVEANGVVCMPALHYRFHPAIKSAREAVASGSIGLPWAVQGDFIIGGVTDDCSVSDLLHLGFFPVDAIRAITALEIRSVYATRGSFFHNNRPRGTEDFAVLALTLDHDVVATVCVGEAPVASHSYSCRGHRRMRIMGSHGTLVVDAAKPLIELRSSARFVHHYYGIDPLRGLLDHLAACMQWGQRPELGPRDARVVLEVILAARTAANENRVVELPLASVTSGERAVRQ